ncbi:MAG: hypothetical protein JJE47_08445 [Acidimicrobiia bacterium]|nr:hypothetical protein [Acidimicrobiia bacterium]
MSRRWQTDRGHVVLLVGQGGVHERMFVVGIGVNVERYDVGNHAKAHRLDIPFGEASENLLADRLDSFASFGCKLGEVLGHSGGVRFHGLNVTRQVRLVSER